MGMGLKVRFRGPVRPICRSSCILAQLGSAENAGHENAKRENDGPNCGA